MIPTHPTDNYNYYIDANGWPVRRGPSMAEYAMSKKKIEKAAEVLEEIYWNTIPDEEKTKIDVDFGEKDGN